MGGSDVFNDKIGAGEKPAFCPLVYICAPYSGDVEENKKRATAFAKFSYEMGNIPVTAHLLFPFLDDTNEDDRVAAIFMDIVLMGKCQEVWVLGESITPGMSIEIEKAKKRRQRVRYFRNDFQEVDGV
jgi:hypothetical protein|uniref:Deoxyribosyltransferase n=1 Tax=Siphoviridae sp. ctgmM3 TaxID=2827912 RepID=A0A8S5TKD8_9CAUD|nr:MAG TPA: deoxyribosyltransferase [Siphoviridae sp. ctgmM3]